MGTFGSVNPQITTFGNTRAPEYVGVCEAESDDRVADCDVVHACGSRERSKVSSGAEVNNVATLTPTQSDSVDQAEIVLSLPTNVPAFLFHCDSSILRLVTRNNQPAIHEQ